MTVLWYVASCSLIKIDRRLGVLSASAKTTFIGDPLDDEGSKKR
jgi:hypothetical protein